MSRPSEFEKELLFRIKIAKLPQPQAEYRFHPKRKWRFDFAWPKQKVAAECEGAVWTRGRHTRGSGFIADCQKYNTAAVMGWIVLRYPRCMIHEAIEDLKVLLKRGKNGVKTALSDMPARSAYLNTTAASL